MDPGKPEPSPGDIEVHDALAAFDAHLLDKASQARLVYGPDIDADAICALLRDRKFVRYPTGIHFDAGQLQPHEFAWPRPLGFHPSDGYCLLIHPGFKDHREAWPLLIAYHIPSINYSALVEPRHAELFAAALLGLEIETCYQQLCRLADAPGMSL